MLYQFLLYSKLNQFYVYIYALFFRFPSHLGHHRSLSRVLYGIQLVICFTHVCVKSLQSCPSLCNRMDCSPPGSSVHRILQARILEWVAMPSTRGSSQPRDGTHLFYTSSIGRRALYHQRHVGSPFYTQQCIYVNPSLPICPTSLGNHKFLLYICDSISALQINSSVPLFQIPHVSDIMFFSSFLFHSV